MLKKEDGKFKRNKSLASAVFILAILLISVISFIGLVSAAGVSTPYWSTNPLKLQPGESTVFSLGLQNMVGTEDITLRANITKGNEIARIIDANTDYFVPLGSDDVTVNIEVAIPQDAEVNKVYGLEVSFLQVGGAGEGGFFAVATAFTQKIPVLVVSEPTESAVYQPSPQKQGVSNTTWLILALVILGIIVVAVVIKRRRR